MVLEQINLSFMIYCFVLLDNQNAVIFYLMIYAIPTAEAKWSKKRKSGGEDLENQISNDQNLDAFEDKVRKRRETYMLVITVRILNYQFYYFIRLFYAMEITSFCSFIDC